MNYFKITVLHEKDCFTDYKYRLQKFCLQSRKCKFAKQNFVERRFR